MSALMCDFVQDSGSADGVNNRCLSSGYKNMGNESLELPSEVSNEGNLYRSLVQLGLTQKNDWHSQKIREDAQSEHKGPHPVLNFLASAVFCAVTQPTLHQD